MNSLELAPRNIYVLNLPQSCNRQQLFDFYSKFGSINHLCILATLDSRGRRRAFINFDHHSAAIRAVRETDGITLGPQQHRISTSFSDNQKNIPTQSTSGSPRFISGAEGPDHWRESSGDGQRGVGGVYGVEFGGAMSNDRFDFREQWEDSPQIIRSAPALTYSAHASSSSSDPNSDEINYDDFDYVYSGSGRQLFTHRSPARNQRLTPVETQFDNSRRGAVSLTSSLSPHCIEGGAGNLVFRAQESAASDWDLNSKKGNGFDRLNPSASPFYSTSASSYSSF